MFRATWLQFNSILGCRHCVWIIRKSSACSNCVSFTRRWPRLQLQLPPTRAEHGCQSHRRNCLGIGMDAPPLVYKLLWSGHRRMNSFGRWWRKGEGRDGRKRGRGWVKRVLEKQLSPVAANWIEIYCQCSSPFNPECGWEALKIQSFSNMTITLER